MQLDLYGVWRLVIIVADSQPCLWVVVIHVQDMSLAAQHWAGWWEPYISSKVHMGSACRSLKAECFQELQQYSSRPPSLVLLPCLSLFADVQDLLPPNIASPNLPTSTRREVLDNMLDVIETNLSIAVRPESMLPRPYSHCFLWSSSSFDRRSMCVSVTNPGGWCVWNGWRARCGCADGCNSLHTILKQVILMQCNSLLQTPLQHGLSPHHTAICCSLGVPEGCIGVIVFQPSGSRISHNCSSLSILGAICWLQAQPLCYVDLPQPAKWVGHQCTARGAGQSNGRVNTSIGTVHSTARKHGNQYRAQQFQK